MSCFYSLGPDMRSQMFRKRQQRLDSRSPLQLYHEGTWHLWGTNNRTQNIEQAVAYFQRSVSLSASRWMLEVILGLSDSLRSPLALARAFEATDTPLGLTCAAILLGFFHPECEPLIKKAAEAGESTGVADGVLGWMVHAGRFTTGKYAGGNPDLGFRLFQRAAAKGDPYGTMCMGNAYLTGEGVQKDVNRGKEVLEKAAKMGWIQPMGKFAELTDSVEKRILWLGRSFYCAQDDFLDILYQVCKDPDPQKVFFLGKAFYWDVYETKEWEEEAENDADQRAFASMCFSLYCDTIDAVRRSALCIVWARKELGLPKELGQMIGRLVWEDRERVLEQTALPSCSPKKQRI